jgi:hypothetical protein
MLRPVRFWTVWMSSFAPAVGSLAPPPSEKAELSLFIP